MRDFRQLKVWHKAHELALEVFKATQLFPREETYGLACQLRLAVTSIPSNIAEGTGRGSKSELKQFMVIASGSVCEVDYQVLLACELGYISEEVRLRLQEQITEVKKMLMTYIRRIETTL